MFAGNAGIPTIVVVRSPIQGGVLDVKVRSQLQRIPFFTVVNFPCPLHSK